MTPVSLAVVDYQPMMLESVIKHLSEIDRFDVVAQGASSDDALSIVKHHRPYLLIMDIAAPHDALRVIARIRAGATGTKVIVFTAESSNDHAIDALDAGAAGYVLKTSTAGDLTRAML